MKVEVTIAIDYDDDTVHSPNMLVADLYDNIKNAIGNGILTGPDHDLLVDYYTLKIQKIEFEYPKFFLDKNATGTT